MWWVFRATLIFEMKVLVSLVDYYNAVFLFNCSYELKKEAISEYPATSFTYASVLWRTRYITIVAILLQWSWPCKKWNANCVFTWRSVWFDIHVQYWCFVLSEITRRGLSRFNETSILKMNVGTCETSSKVNFVFQHSL